MLNNITNDANNNVTMINLVANILNGPASIKPNLAAINALPQRKIKQNCKRKFIIWVLIMWKEIQTIK